MHFGFGYMKNVLKTASVMRNEGKRHRNLYQGFPLANCEYDTDIAHDYNNIAKITNLDDLCRFHLLPP